MAMLCFFGILPLYIWLVRKCIRTSVDGIKAPRVEIPDTVPSEWIKAYKAENDA